MLDELLPTYDTVERHHRLVAASPDATYTALKSLTMRELPLVRLLFGIRSLPAVLTGHRGLPGDDGRPMLDGFARIGFTMLKDEPGDELVLGVIGQLWRPSGRIVRFADVEEFTAFDRPGFAKAAVTFQFRATGGRAEPSLRSGASRDRTAVSTETRIATTSTAAALAFARYWLLIGPFSGIVRRSWLGGAGAPGRANLTGEHSPLWTVKLKVAPRPERHVLKQYGVNSSGKLERKNGCPLLPLRQAGFGQNYRHGKQSLRNPHATANSALFWKTPGPVPALAVPAHLPVRTHYYPRPRNYSNS